jgi:hypothetical protein
MTSINPASPPKMPAITHTIAMAAKTPTKTRKKRNLMMNSMVASLKALHAIIRIKHAKMLNNQSGNYESSRNRSSQHDKLLHVLALTFFLGFDQYVASVDVNHIHWSLLLQKDCYTQITYTSFIRTY